MGLVVGNPRDLRAVHFLRCIRFRSRYPPPSLWRDRDFRRLWVGQTASQLGEHTTLIVLPLFAVLTLHAGAGELGVLRAVGQAPILLLSLFVGAWVDRWRTRTVMVVTDAGRTLVLGAAAVAGLLGWFGLPALLVVAFAVGALSVFFDVAYQASLVRLVRRDQLLQGNSALEGSRSAAQIGGPALGGALVSLLSAPLAAASSAVFFALSFLSIRRIRRTEQALGQAIGHSLEQVASVEQGRRPAKEAFTEAAERVLDARGVLEVLQPDVDRAKLPRFFRNFAAVEAEVLSRFSYDPLLVPGLLQTEATSRAVFAGHCPPFGEEIMDQAPRRHDFSRRRTADARPDGGAVVHHQGGGAARSWAVRWSCAANGNACWR
ncbi:hypothetical protein SHIRM173S_12573 [Streptomyces hirsutus]